MDKASRLVSGCRGQGGSWFFIISQIPEQAFLDLLIDPEAERTARTGALGLLERDAELGVLTELLDRAGDGSGEVALVTGEAGIGKSALVQEFVETVEDGKVLWGQCDDLLTPRPLGPIHDMGREIGGAIGEALRDGFDRIGIFEVVMDELQSPPSPTLFVVDDVHWADEATIDLLTFLGRRITGIPTVMILTYRPEEVAPGHPLIQTLAAMPPNAVTRMELAPLSEIAVDQLTHEADRSIDTRIAFELTSGNPFYVTEILAAGGWEPDQVPSSVAQVVTTRLGRLPKETRRVAELVSVVPSRVDFELLRACEPLWSEALEPAEEIGLVTLGARTVSYRHELARRAVEAEMPELRRRALHRRVLDGLIEVGDPEPAAVVHHATRAGADDMLAEWGPRAARAAVRAEAHREALAHYERTAAVADLIEEADRASIFEQLASESLNAGRHNQALDAINRALSVHESRNDDAARSKALIARSWIHWVEARREKGYADSQEAARLLEPLEEGPVHALLQAHVARISMADWRLADALELGQQAIRLAEKYDQPSALANALNTVGTSKLLREEDEGEQYLARSMKVAQQASSEQDVDLSRFAGGAVPHAHINLATTAIEARRYSRARQAIYDGLAYARDSERIGHVDYLDATRARLLMETGELDEAVRLGDEVLSRSRQLGVSAVPAAYAAGRACVRTGASAAERYLERAWDVADQSGELQRTGRVVFARAELAWYRDDLSDLVDALGEVLAEGTSLGFPWVAGEAALWLRRAGIQPEESPVAEPFRLMMEGSFIEAAASWADIGCPYEQAECLTETGEPSSMIEGLKLLDDLGAVPLARLTRSRLRRMGVKGVPRGPRPATRENPYGLTPRQMEVLALVADGLTNTEIAERLYLSVRTVDHHVSAILTQLGVDNREDAAAILPEADGDSG